MTPDDIGRILAKAAAYDRRTVGEADIMAWFEAIGDLDVHDALDAVGAHYRSTAEWIQPAHVRDRARIAREERDHLERRSLLALPPGRFDDDPTRADRIAAGVAQARAALPAETDSERIGRVAIARARNEHGKPMRPERRARGDRKPVEIDPIDDDVATLAAHYLRTGYTPTQVAERLAISRQWCERAARRLSGLGPVGWCGLCTYDGRMRKVSALADPIPCPECTPSTEES